MTHTRYRYVNLTPEEYYKSTKFGCIDVYDNKGLAINNREDTETTYRLVRVRGQ